MARPLKAGARNEALRAALLRRVTEAMVKMLLGIGRLEAEGRNEDTPDRGGGRGYKKRNARRGAVGWEEKKLGRPFL